MATADSNGRSDAPASAVDVAARDSKAQGSSGPARGDGDPAADALAAQATSIPPGIRVLWSERQARVSLMVEIVEPEDPRVDVADDGRIVIGIRDGDGREQRIVLELLRNIDAAKTSWVLSGRGLAFDVAKLAVGRWGQLVKGVAPANVKVNWAQYVDEEEEVEMQRNPMGHDMLKMRGAMGTDFGSNVDASIAARKQAEKLNTSKGDEEEEEITLC